MSRTNSSVEHPGIIDQIDHDTINVKILSLSACASCHAKGACGLSDMQEKIIEVPNKTEYNFKPGDKVTIVMERAMGRKAVFIAYIIPFLILVSSLALLIHLTDNEAISGLISIGLLVPFYLTLYLLRDKMKTDFRPRLKV